MIIKDTAIVEFALTAVLRHKKVDDATAERAKNELKNLAGSQLWRNHGGRAQQIPEVFTEQKE